ncbi:Hsp70 family protein [Arenicella xantha]|uniref:Putative chaperone protein n=1 Tax=Arenicella xantha TaxID=644221 RepID=A0A395JR53_9GAMM|nr:Hsp70 family protein [Arenicella xantha]RBP51190.1 putative chaperone protein [Arenicella xantha]
MKHIGLDFGTANTSVSVLDGEELAVLPLERQSVSLPSTLFFDFEDGSTQIGQAAFDRYYFGDQGRFLRSFKSALGTRTIDHTIRIKHDTYQIRDIIRHYIGEVLSRAQAQLGTTIDSLVVGRPVNFIDDNPLADQQAEDTLRQIVSDLGVSNIEFQLEPIAAALNYGVTIVGEEVVLVIDIGAGTSDFSVVKFQAKGSADSVKSEVIANCGIHIGGNDFDKVIALERVMPLFGYRQRFKRRPELEAPRSYFLNASSWHQIDLLYDRKVLATLAELEPQMEQPDTFARFSQLIRSRQPHKVLTSVEQAKRKLGADDATQVEMPFVEDSVSLPLSVSQLNTHINELCIQIIATANQAIENAGLKKPDIDTVYLTGGSMGIRHLSQMVASEFEHSKIVEGDRSTAVARGLALDAKVKFG